MAQSKYAALHEDAPRPSKYSALHDEEPASDLDAGGEVPASERGLGWQKVGDEAPVPGPDEVRVRGLLDRIKSAGLGLAHGTTAEFADELSGGVGAGIEKLMGSDKPIGELYRANRDADRSYWASERKKDPWAFGAGDIAGNVVTGIATTPLLPGGVAASGSKALARQGFIQGGLQGLGASTADSALDMAGDTAGGAIMGAAAGATSPYIAKAVGGVAGALRHPVDTAKSAAASLAGLPLKAINRLGGKAPRTSIIDDVARETEKAVAPSVPASEQETTLTPIKNWLREGEYGGVGGKRPPKPGHFHSKKTAWDEVVDASGDINSREQSLDAGHFDAVAQLVGPVKNTKDAFNKLLLNFERELGAPKSYKALQKTIDFMKKEVPGLEHMQMPAHALESVASEVSQPSFNVARMNTDNAAERMAAAKASPEMSELAEMLGQGPHAKIIAPEEIAARQKLEANPAQIRNEGALKHPMNIKPGPAQSRTFIENDPADLTSRFSQPTAEQQAAQQLEAEAAMDREISGMYRNARGADNDVVGQSAHARDAMAPPDGFRSPDEADEAFARAMDKPRAVSPPPSAPPPVDGGGPSTKVLGPKPENNAWGAGERKSTPKPAQASPEGQAAVSAEHYAARKAAGQTTHDNPTAVLEEFSGNKAYGLEDDPVKGFTEWLASRNNPPKAPRPQQPNNPWGQEPPLELDYAKATKPQMRNAAGYAGNVPPPYSAPATDPRFAKGMERLKSAGGILGGASAAMAAGPSAMAIPAAYAGYKGGQAAARGAGDFAQKAAAWSQKVLADPAKLQQLEQQGGQIGSAAGWILEGMRSGGEASMTARSFSVAAQPWFRQLLADQDEQDEAR